MIQKIKTLILAAMLPLALAAPVALTTGAVYAAEPCVSSAPGTNTDTSIDQGLSSGTNAALTGNCATPTGQGQSNFQALAGKIVNLLSIIVGVIAVIMIVYGGFRYITSGGESGNVSSAKNTLIYAIVGLIIVALAQFIVHFVLDNIGNVT